MSASSNDILLQRAAVFADEVRQIQSKSGKKFSAGIHLSPESQDAITKAASGSATVAVMSKAGEGTALRTVFERFEEMCRRRKCNIDVELRAALVEILAGELSANHSALGGSATGLIGVTILQSAIGPDLIKEFACFSETVLRAAAVSYPADPRDFLRKVASTIDAITTEPEFARFRKTPDALREAAMNYPANPRGFLRKVASTIDAVASEPEFNRFRETPGSSQQRR